MKYYAEQPWIPDSLVPDLSPRGVTNLVPGDRLPIAEYPQAIARVIREGDAVLDLSAGIGVLSQWALKFGADKVYAIEANAEALSLAADRISASGYGSRFVAINTVSCDATLPEKADVVVSEVMGNLGDNTEGQFALADAYRRLLKENCRSIPRGLSTYVVPVSAPRAHDNVAAQNVSALDTGQNIRKLMQTLGIRSEFNLYYDTIVSHTAHLSAPQPVMHYRERWQQQPVYSRRLYFSVQKNGLFTGFKGYFVAELSERDTLDISSDRIKRRTTAQAWRHAYLPVETPLAAAVGDVLVLEYSRLAPAARAKVPHVYRWRGELLRDGKAVGRFDQCLDETLIGR